MFLAHLTGRVAPDALERAFSADFVAADSAAILLLREDGRVVSPALARSRGVLHFAYRVALAPEVPAATAFEEGWIDAIGTSDEAAAWERDPAFSGAARQAASAQLSIPSREGALALERARFALIQASEEKRERIDAFFASRRGGNTAP